MKILDERDKEEILGKLKLFSKEFEFQGITLADVELDRCFHMISGGGLGYLLHETILEESLPGHCMYNKEVKQGDMFVMTNAHILTSDTPYLVFASLENVVIDIVEFTNAQNYAFPEDGYLYICYDYTTVQAGEFFYLKTPSSTEPLVLYAEKAEEYAVDTTAGDEALKAIMEGRQIKIRVPNADGGNTTAIYSPVLMEQLPNYLNDYLYLFYLRDEKQDLSSLGLTGVQLPTYGELKMKLSRTYNQTPLI